MQGLGKGGALSLVLIVQATDGRLAAKAGQGIFDKVTEDGKTKKDSTSSDFQGNLLKALSINRVQVGAPKIDKGSSQKSRTENPGKC